MSLSALRKRVGPINRLHWVFLSVACAWTAANTYWVLSQRSEEFEQDCSETGTRFLAEERVAKQQRREEAGSS